MKKAMKRLMEKVDVKRFKKLSNNKGFSLIELLIVIAIMGVLAVIAFNMFGGVLSNSKKKADDQQAANIQKALTMYCVESGDWGLTGKGGVTDAADDDAYTLAITTGDSTDADVIAFLLSEVLVEGEKYGPMLTPKDLDIAQNEGANITAFAPQWNAGAGGKNVGYVIVVDAPKQAVSVKPTDDTDSAKITLK